jgi:hypothetical protein
VPDEGNYATLSRFDPATGTLRVERWLPDLDTMDKLRALVKDGAGKPPVKGCGADAEHLSRIASIGTDMAALLPAQPNERLIYHCQKGRLAPVDPTP